MRIGIGYLAIFAASSLCAQTLRLYSEFQRVDPYGDILPTDRAAQPREILSPAVARNAFASFQVVVTAPAKTNYFLYVVTNPADQFRLALYKEQFVRTGIGWIPDTLEPVRLPCFGTMPDAEVDIPGQTTRTYLLDVWVPPETLVRRVRLEVLLKTAGWIVAPMEVRVAAARVPEVPDIAGAIPGITRRSDAAAWGPLSHYLFDSPERVDAHALTLRDIIRRNARQDMALAQSIEAARYPRAASLDVMLTAGREIVASWSADPTFADPQGAEWYLRVRDLLLRYIP